MWGACLSLGVMVIFVLKAHWVSRFIFKAVDRCVESEWREKLHGHGTLKHTRYGWLQGVWRCVVSLVKELQGPVWVGG